ncbi:acyl-CoA oxidase, partial [Phenoliferia sp. Uapishka_3]
MSNGTPQNTCYVVHSGARQQNSDWDPAENGGVVLDTPLDPDKPPDPFALLERTQTQKVRALSAAGQLQALEELQSSRWSDPYAASKALRSSFRKDKKVRVASEGRAEGVRAKYALGDRVTKEDLRTPAREVLDQESREWEEAQRERGRREEIRLGKRRRESDQVGWREEEKASTSAGSLSRREKTTSSSSRNFASRHPSDRPIKSLPTKKPSKAVQSLAKTLALNSAIKADPFRLEASTGKLKSLHTWQLPNPQSKPMIQMVSEISQSTIDIRAARASASFSSLVIQAALYNAQESEVRDRVRSVLEKDSAFAKRRRPYLSRQERLEQGLQMTRRLIELRDEQGWSHAEFTQATSLADEALPLHLHEVAFIPVIASQGSDEQQRIWLPQASAHAILGAYLQTELGHGSNVQQLETTATFDSAKDEFIINSPTVTSTKWWIGALGLLATHGAVQARLIINGKDLGPHLFLMQLRCLDTHQTLPGVTIGEIGPKIHGGYNTVDNGWASFDNVRVPRNQMLSRFAQVARDGSYKKPPHSKLSYGGMIFIRAQMIGGLASALAKAATISTRYLHIRRQSPIKPLLNPLPEQILYTSMSQQLQRGDTTLLAETHAVSSGLKSYVTAHVIEGIETVRRAMGGHGFLDAAGVGKIYAQNLPSATYEGDNFILNLQVARAALKTLASLRSNPSTQLSPSTAYLSSLRSRASRTALILDSSTWLSRPLQLHVISLRAALQVERLERLLASGKPFSQLSHECVSVSTAIVEAFLMSRTMAAVEDAGLLMRGVGPAERKVMDLLVDFYNLITIEAALSDLLEFEIIKPVPPTASAADVLSGPVQTLRDQIDLLALKLLPESIGLTDAFGFSDWDLGSELGKYDGRAYESLLEKAKLDLDMNVGNSTHRQKLYENEIRPILMRGKTTSSKL